MVHRGVGRDFDGRGGFAAEHRAAAGGEDQDIGAAGHDARHAHGIVSRRVHDHEAFCLDRLRVTYDIDEGRAAALGYGAQRFFIDRGESAFLVPRRGIVVDLGAENARVPFPPFDPLDELFANSPADGSSR